MTFSKYVYGTVQRAGSIVGAGQIWLPGRSLGPLGIDSVKSTTVGAVEADPLDQGGKMKGIE